MSLIITRPIELDPYDPETDLTPAEEIVTIYDHTSWARPKRSYANLVNTFYDWAEASFATILTLLGVSEAKWNEIIVFTPSSKVDAVAGSRLITEAEATTISAVVAPKRLTLPASAEVSGRIAGATKPSGWTIAAVDGTDLLITHTLTGRKIVSINVFSTDTGVDRWLPSGSVAYAGFTGDATTVTIEGLTNIDLPLRIELIFS